jgi:H+/gluconate symporter-like permease
MDIQFWYPFLALILLINLLVSIYRTKKDYLETFQKLAQIIMVWLIAIVAAIGLLLFHRSQDLPITSSKSNGSGANQNADVAGIGD